MGDKSGERAPSVKDNDELVDGTIDTRALSRHGAHDKRAVAKETRGSATSSGELDTQRVRGGSPGSPLVGREAIKRGVRIPDRLVLPT